MSVGCLPATYGRRTTRAVGMLCCCYLTPTAGGGAAHGAMAVLATGADDSAAEEAFSPGRVSDCEVESPLRHGKEGAGKAAWKAGNGEKAAETQGKQDSTQAEEEKEEEGEKEEEEREEEEYSDDAMDNNDGSEYGYSNGGHSDDAGGRSSPVSETNLKKRNRNRNQNQNKINPQRLAKQGNNKSLFFQTASPDPITPCSTLQTAVVSVRSFHGVVLVLFIIIPWRCDWLRTFHRCVCLLVYWLVCPRGFRSRPRCYPGPRAPPATAPAANNNNKHQQLYPPTNTPVLTNQHTRQHKHITTRSPLPPPPLSTPTPPCTVLAIPSTNANEPCLRF